MVAGKLHVPRGQGAWLLADALLWHVVLNYCAFSCYLETLMPTTSSHQRVAFGWKRLGINHGGLMSWAAIAKCHELGGSAHGAVLSPSAGGWPAEIKVSVGWFPLRLCTEPFPASSGFRSLPAILGIIWGTCGGLPRSCHQPEEKQATRSPVTYDPFWERFPDSQLLTCRAHRTTGLGRGRRTL